MIAVDTNILVYSHREDSAFFKPAEEVVRTLAEAGKDWAIPWPCIHEFVAIVTHPHIYRPPTPLERACTQVRAWIESPHLHCIGEIEAVYWPVLESLLQNGSIAGPKVHDARIAAVCLCHGIDELWTADRDFSRFPGLTVRNPLVH